MTFTARQRIQRWVFVLAFVLGVPALSIWLCMPFLDMSHATYLTATKDYRGAIQALDRAVAFNGVLSSAHVKRGYVYTLLNEKEKALEDFASALRINSQDWAAHNNRAWLVAQDDPKAALADASRAIELCPTCPQAFHTRGVIYSKLGDKNNASADFTRAIELDPKYEISAEDRAKLGEESQ